jgi:hypothetical protein
MRKLFVSLLFSSLTLLGADFAGVWIGQIPVGKDGALQDIMFQITQTGPAIGGKMYGDYQSSPISEARVSGDLITFVVVGAQQSGNEINTTRLRFTGSLKDGALELTRDREGATTAGNGGTFVVKANTKQTFRLKRLY